MNKIRLCIVASLVFFGGILGENIFVEQPKKKERAKKKTRRLLSSDT